MKVGDESPCLPWIGAYFMAENLRDQQGLTIAERIVGEASDEEDEPMSEQEAHDAGVCYMECGPCANEQNNHNDN